MKRCTKCRQRFDDSFVQCPDCGYYLIGDFSDSTFSWSMPPPSETHGNDEGDFAQDSQPAETRRARRGRIEVVETQSDGGEGNSDAFASGGFIPDNSDRITIAGTDSQPDGRQPVRRRRRRNSARVFTGMWRVIRVLLPLLLILGAVWFAVINWTQLQGFLSLCGTGALIGAIAALWLSRNSMNAFAPRILFTGALIGAVIACVISYGAFDIDMEVMAEGIGTLAITLFGIYLIFRSIR